MGKSNELKPAAIYVRRSCARSNDASCGDQIASCTRAMAKSGYFLAKEENVYEDDISSGLQFFTRNRMSVILNILRETVPLNPRPYDAIFIDDVSRVARNIAFTALFVQALRFHDIKLFDARGEEYTSSMGYSYLLFQGLTAEMERNFLSYRTSRGIRAAAKRMSKSAKVYGYHPSISNKNIGE
jgi:DNA invertase Pin-like site-specific DNA recombinase